MIAIVGAGITGLALAHELDRRGAEFVVLEASDVPGGVIRSAVVEGRLLEWGPQRTRLTGPIGTLVAELGLQGEVVQAPAGLPLLVYADGRLRQVSFSAAGMLSGDLLSPAARLRLLLEPLTAGARDDETVADYFTRKLGRQAYERMAGPLYGGLYASDPADMLVGLSLGHVLREFQVGRSLGWKLLRRGGRVVAPPACSFREGMAALPRALHRRHAARVHLSMPVHALERTGAGYRLTTDAGPIAARHVVVTANAPAAAGLLGGVVPDAARRIATLKYNPLAVVHLHAAGGVPAALGYQVALGERLVTRGVTFNAAMFGRDGVYTAYLGGAKAPQVVDLPDAEIGDAAVREFRQVTGADARVLSVARERMPAWDRTWAAVTDLRLPEGLHVAANWESRPGLPGRLAQARRLAEALVS
jgi:oxygen-dependent protoporphyrinogen oxidase